MLHTAVAMKLTRMKRNQSLLEKLNLMEYLVCLLTLILMSGVTLNPEPRASRHMVLQLSPQILQVGSFLGLASFRVI